MKQITTHKEHLVSLKRIEGQVRGIQKMINEQKYCIDILTQLNSIIGAVTRVRNNIFCSHIKGCVAQSFKTGSRMQRQKKIEEIVTLISRCRNI
jgi:DNA-binding FrmR family transcriptional regulator